MEDTAAYLRRVVTVLARELGVRSYLDTDTLEKTALYLSGELAALGYEVVRQPFRYSGATYYNIVTEIRGASTPEQILVVGAHYDTVRTTAGADDNGSGVAGLLALARSLAGAALEKTVRLAAFCLEEPPVYRTPHMGSYHYARSIQEKRGQVEGMICLEMIGFYSDRADSQHYPLPFMNRVFPKAGNFIAFVGNRKSRSFTRMTAEYFQKGTDLPAVTLNAPAFVLGIDFSDHWSFGKFGIKALMVTDTAFYRNPNYHAPSDLPETLDYERMAKVVDGLVAAVKAWAGG